MIIMRISTAENDDDYDDGQNPCFGELESARFSRTHVVGKVILEKKMTTWLSDLSHIFSVVPFSGLSSVPLPALRRSSNRSNLM